MENNLKNIINKYKAKKITLKNSAKIIENENTRLVIKKDIQKKDYMIFVDIQKQDFLLINLNHLSMTQ